MGAGANGWAAAVLRVGLAAGIGLAVPAVRVGAQQAKSAPGLPLEHRPERTRPVIDEQDLMTRVYILAADSMGGRAAGERGNVQATDYLAAEAKGLGLRPAGDSGSFFQAIPLVFRSPDTASSLRVAGAPLALRKDFVAIPGEPAFPFGWGFEATAARPVYGGRVGDSLGLTPERMAGRVVVLGPPLVHGREGFAFWAIPGWERYRGAAAVLVATLDLSPAWMIPEAFRPVPVLGGSSGATGSAPGGAVVARSVVERLFGRPLAELRPGDEGRALDARVGFVDRPAAFPARNVVAVLPGRDPVLAAEYVALGAHSDHVGTGPALPHDSLEAFHRVMRPGGERSTPAPSPEQWVRILAVRDSLRAVWPERLDSVFNGAEDDASGVAAVLEVAERLSAGPRPRRSVLFVWHTAEEQRYLGARWFTDHPTVPREAIVAEINLDGYAHRTGVGPEVDGGVQGDLAAVGAARLSGAFGALVAAVAAREGIRLDGRYDAPGDPSQYYCRSDHYLYARYGIPSVFFTAGMYPAYHQMTDEAQYLEYPRLARQTRFAAELVRATAELERRPAVDPGRTVDPGAACVQ